MSASSAGWNELGDVWLVWLCERSLAGTAALGLVMIVIVALPRRCSAHLPSHLLLLPLLLFAVPLERLLPGPWSGPLPPLDGLVAGPGALMPTSVAPAAPWPTIANEVAFGSAAKPQLTAAPEPGLRWPALAMIAWTTVVACGAARLWHRQRTSRRQLLVAARPANAALRLTFRQLRREAGVGGSVALRLVPGLASPLVAGALRPILYVPSDLASDLPPTQLAFALRHELEHVRRRDVVTSTFAAGVGLAFCFHPLVWLTTALLAHWREFACDEAALARTTGRRSEVAATLLRLVERACSSPPALPGHAHLFATRHFMHHRLQRILDPNRLPKTRMTTMAATTFAILSLGTLFAVRSHAQEPTPGPAPAETPASAPNPAAAALTEGARWLLQTQQADGSWAIGRDPAGKNQRDHNPVCVTAMAVRALLPGLREEKLKIAEAVRRAAKFLAASQQTNGQFGPNEYPTMMYAHGNTLRALSAVQREWPEDERLASIQRGVDYAQAARNPYMGWRYGPREGDNDSKITAVMLLGLRAAKDVGAAVDEKALSEAQELLEQLTNAENGRTGFLKRGDVMSRFTSKQATFPGVFSEEPTALHLLVRHAAGEPLDRREVDRRSVALVLALPPEWDPAKGTIDLAYWEFGAEVLALVGGAEAQLWRTKLHASLLPHRIVDAGAAHWPTIDAWSHPGMEVYTTTSAMLALRALR